MCVDVCVLYIVICKPLGMIVLFIKNYLMGIYSICVVIFSCPISGDHHAIGVKEKIPINADNVLVLIISFP